MLCLSVRFVEYFLIETDKTAISLLLGSVCFAVSFGLGNPAHLEIYISSFSLTGSQMKNTDLRPFMQANFIAAFLFGIWHIVMPIRSYVNGEMSFAAMLLMAIGYIILVGIMGIKWGLLYRITGNLWAGLGDHLFNNTVATNMLHVVSQNGADELQIVRIMAAQIISFVFVLMIHAYRTTNVR